MIQELFGSSSPLLGTNVGVVNGDTKLISISSNGGIILGSTPAAPPSSSSPSSNNSSSSAATLSAKKCSGPAAGGAGSNNGALEGQQNLRCPRCDSPNTKFCYYNNYNLTQPRHFCKTCRRYWTKGGALRNVPIGGGCRKNKASTISSSVAKSSATKFKSLSASGFIGGLDHELPSNPVMWGSTHGSHLLALLRGSPINPNPNPSSFIKEELHMLGGHVMIEPGMGTADGMSPCGLGLDPMNQPPSMGLCSSFFRNITQQSSIQQNPAPNPRSHSNGGFNILSEVPNDNAIHALYQRLKLATGDYDTDRSHMVAQNSQDTAPTSSPTPPALESGSGGIGSDQLGYWSGNNTLNMCWSDLPTSNGAYP